MPIFLRQELLAPTNPYKHSGVEAEEENTFM